MARLRAELVHREEEHHFELQLERAAKREHGAQVPARRSRPHRRGRPESASSRMVAGLPPVRHRRSAIDLDLGEETRYGQYRHAPQQAAHSHGPDGPPRRAVTPLGLSSSGLMDDPRFSAAGGASEDQNAPSLWVEASLKPLDTSVGPLKFPPLAAWEPHTAATPRSNRRGYRGRRSAQHPRSRSPIQLPAVAAVPAVDPSVASSRPGTSGSLAMSLQGDSRFVMPDGHTVSRKVGRNPLLPGKGSERNGRRTHRPRRRPHDGDLEPISHRSDTTSAKGAATSVVPPLPLHHMRTSHTNPSKEPVALSGGGGGGGGSSDDLSRSAARDVDVDVDVDSYDDGSDSDDSVDFDELLALNQQRLRVLAALQMQSNLTTDSVRRALLAMPDDAFTARDLITSSRSPFLEEVSPRPPLPQPSRARRSTRTRDSTLTARRPPRMPTNQAPRAYVLAVPSRVSPRREDDDTRSLQGDSRFLGEVRM